MRISKWGADLVISLVEADEMVEIGVPNLGASVRKLGLAWHHFPIEDLKAPNWSQVADWRRSAWQVHRVLDSGGKVVIHCRGGLGRAGTLAAMILIEREDLADDAIAWVRKARPGAIETIEPERFLKSLPAPETTRARRIQASFYGGAIGDSLGAEIEFLDLSGIRSRFPEGLNKLLPHDGVLGAITDDTQMTLFTAEGLLRAQVRELSKGICDPASVVHHALLRWYVTQGGTPQPETDDTGLVLDGRLQRRRAPGSTCLSALAQAERFGGTAHNQSKGCGTIMRVAPVALCGVSGPSEQAMRCSALTHGHRTGQEAAAAWAVMLRAVLEGEDLEKAASACLSEYGDETRNAIQNALNAPRDRRPETVESLGGGWIAEEALSIALYACLSGESFEDGLKIAVTHSGDSDSTGAIAGNMLGLMYPEQAMSHPWRRQIECSDIINRLAVDLNRLMHSHSDMSSEEFSRFSEMYPGF